MILDELTPDLDKPENDLPERRLFCSIINAALADARSANAKDSLIAREAMDFLLSNRIDPYLELLGYDPEVFRSSLVTSQAQECTRPIAQTENGRMKEIEKENKMRRIFRHNYGLYKQHNKPFKTLVPMSMLYNAPVVVPQSSEWLSAGFSRRVNR